ncbi:MAG: hypothetical protein JXN59_02650 [Anaerolineae bacterium]|nr:hypothetical protein [Anaerolineae bacterium]
MGRNVTIYPGVVVGGDHSHDGAPRLGDNVVLGAGCKVLGPITVGSNVLVGANAVVVKDVPDEAVAVGVPAVVKKRIWTEKHADGSYELPSDEPPAAHGSPVVVQLDALPPDDVGESAR